MPDEEGDTPVEWTAGRRETWLMVAGRTLLALAALLLLRKWGIWFSDAIVWPVMLAGAGGALIWRQIARRRARRPPPPVARAARRPPLRLPRELDRWRPSVPRWWSAAA